MLTNHVFISHAWDDKPLARAMQEQLALHHVTAWLDAREMTAGDALLPTIRKAIDDSSHVLVILSPNTINSAWVTKEVQYALKLQKTRTDGFKVIPLLLPGIKVTGLHHWFKNEPIATFVDIGPGGVDNAMPHILAALGERLPTIIQTVAPTPPAPVTELILELTYPAIEQKDGKRRAVADATLHYKPAETTAREVESDPYVFTAPLGPIETDDLTWYLESYHRLPITVYRQRAQGIEEQLPAWGELLYGQVMQSEAQEAFRAWNDAGKTTTRRFTVSVSSKSRPRSDASAQAEAQEAATLLLALPWELLHDDRSYLFQGARGVRVRRQLPNRYQQEPYTTDAPIRVLLISPRPENKQVAYIDHRVSARPVVDALASLGDLAQLTILTPPTFPALVTELTRAKQAGTPYHVVHFDGHGVYDPRHGLGMLVFEDPNDKDKPGSRNHALVDAQEIAQSIRDCRVPLFFLEACQSAMSDKDPTASVAGRLLEGGVASVVAMSHSVLVETARRFVTAFYGSVLQGERVGQAMLAGQRVLQSDTLRGRTFAGDLHLQDWFVPVLYQEEHDPQLVASVPAAEVQRQKGKASKSRMEHLPPVPTQTFVGRSRELLYAERMLQTRAYVTIQGEGGEGKTTLASELARWLVHSGRFARAAFVSFDKVNTADAALSELGSQLVTNYQSIAGQGGNRGWQAIERALIEQPTIILLDNLESVLELPPSAPGAAAFEPEILAKILALCEQLRDVTGTKLVFTSREAMPAPFDGNTIPLGRLSDSDAVQLVAKTLGENVHMPGTTTDDANEEAIKNLVEAVGGHARALVLIAREVARTGIHNAAANLDRIMQDLHTRYPDDRERSLLASVKLSLDRLPPETRQRIRPLGVFQGGGSLHSIMPALLIKDVKQSIELAQQLVGVGLAELWEYGYLHFDPALVSTLLSEMDVEEQETARTAWVETMQALADYLYRERSYNADLALGVARWELPNLLAALEHQVGTLDAEKVVRFASKVESLSQLLGNRRAVVQAERILTTAVARLPNWNDATFLAENANVDRLLSLSRFGEAISAAERLLLQCKTAGPEAYPNAAYDIALAYATCGRAQFRGGANDTALDLLQKAEHHFTALSHEGDQDAAYMAFSVKEDRAACLSDIGRLEEASELCEQVIVEARQRNNIRSIAVGIGNLGRVRRRQGRYEDALQSFIDTKDMFEQMGEPGSVAISWIHIGTTYYLINDHVLAEQAFSKALQISRLLDDPAGQANALSELGNLYHKVNRNEEASRFFAEAAMIYNGLTDVSGESRARGNMALALFSLRRYDEVRRELECAINLRTQLGHASEPWQAFALMEKLEEAVGNNTAAQQARRQAIQAFLAYRRDGGESISMVKQILASVAQALAIGQNGAVAEYLDELLNTQELSERGKILSRLLQRIVSGERDPALADVPDLDYMDAVELRLLLETLSPTETIPSRPPVIPRPNRTTRRVRPARET